jgi:hypothetical protein
MPQRTFYYAMLMTAALLATLAAPSALAIRTFTVDSTADLPDTNPISGTCHTTADTCTLRAAVMQANRGGADSLIVVPAGTYTLAIHATVADGEADGDLNLTTPTSPGSAVITIAGAGAGTTIIDADQIDRVLHVHPNRSATISGVTIRNGLVLGGSGGGILNEGLLAVSDAIIVDNHAQDGGGIHNAIYMTLVDSTVTQNGAGDDGGGIRNSGLMYITRSTISNNIAYGNGGGVFADGSLFVVNSTVAFNRSSGVGGGIANYEQVNVYNTSIVFNGGAIFSEATAAGGVFTDSDPGPVFNLRNSLVAGNYSSVTHVSYECSGTLNSYARNLFGTDATCPIVSVSGSIGYITDFSTFGPLQDNGGPTFTVALLPGSVAIDSGDAVGGCVDYNSVVLPTDQRGQPRVVGARCDIGAYEFNPLPSPVQLSAVSRKMHGAAGTFDLPLSAVATNPTTEPRTGPAQIIVFTFDKPINSATATVTEGTALAGPPAFSGNTVIVGLTGVNNQQYVTLALTAVAGTDGSTGGTGSVRVGFLAGDVNQNRVVTLADLGLVNAQLAQSVTASNYLKDVNASGTLTLSDKGITNANLTKALPTP